MGKARCAPPPAEEQNEKGGEGVKVGQAKSGANIKENVTAGFFVPRLSKACFCCRERLFGRLFQSRQVFIEIGPKIIQNM